MRELTREETVLLHLLGCSLNPETGQLPDDMLLQTDWKAVMDESAQQAVLLLAFDTAAAYKKFIPDEVWQVWFQRSSRVLASNLRVNQSQRELVGLLDEKGYPYVILKGEAAAAYYPKPELRHLGDVDFLIDPEQKDAVERHLTAAGYTGGMHEHICHVVLKKPGSHLEMHFEIAGIPYGKPGERVREYMADVLSCAKRAESGNGSFCMPDGAHHGLILLLHMQHHMVSEGLGLRHLCDWAAFVNQTWSEPFWQERLLPLLRQIGLLRYAAVMTRVSADTLGTACPEWAAAEAELCRGVLLDILAGGNFGCKDAVRSKSGMMISEHGKDGTGHRAVYNLWKTLHASTPDRFPIVRKVPVLYPILDVYRAGLYMIRTARGKRPSLVKLAPLAQERRSTYQQLRIFETDETGD